MFYRVFQNMVFLEAESIKTLKVSKKLRPRADISTPNHRHGLETRTLYGTTGKIMTNDKFLPKVFATE
jgi:hypothetical protein